MGQREEISEGGGVGGARNGGGFSGRNILTSRLEGVHSGAMSHSCDTCLQSFSEAGSLALHQRVHTREKPSSSRHQQ